MKRSLKPYSLSHKALASLLSVAVVFSTAFPEAALALPRGGVVAKGLASLTYSTNGLRIGQSTSSASFNWTSYNVKSGQSVVYSVPTTQSVSLNFIGGTAPSTISGSVKSNGILEFMNTNGLIFGSGSTVSAAGVMAFGAATPWGTPTGPVSNAGVLTATNNGTVVLVGTSVSNSGTISASGGEVILAAGSTVTPVSATGSSSLSVATTGGGSIDDSGVIATETVGPKTGTILLQSGMNSGMTTLEPTAVLDASAPNGGNGGNITVNGHTVVLDETAPLNVSAALGTPGTVVIDPTVTDVGTASALEAIDTSQTTYLNNFSVCIVLTANINMADGTLSNGTNPYSWTPLGTSNASAFTGTFNGNGHTVSGYTIGTSTSNYSGNDVGFIGYLGSGGYVKNLGVAGTIYASGSCVGGVVGSNIHGTVEYSYNMGTVNATLGSVGGVAGVNCGTVKYSYNTGAVKAAGCGVGGVVGLTSGTVEYSYNTGGVTGTGSDVGGVVGDNSSSASDNYFLSSSSTYALGNYTTSSGTNGTNVALTSFSTTNPTTTFSNWSGLFNTWDKTTGSFNTTPLTTAPWYEGTVVSGNGAMSAPMLVPDLATATVTENSGTSIYSGSTVTAGYTATYTMGGTSLSPNVMVTTSVGPSVGTYTNTPTVSISAPTTQTGVIFVSKVSGTWTITPASSSSGSSSSTSTTTSGSSSATTTKSQTSAPGNFAPIAEVVFSSMQALDPFVATLGGSVTALAPASSEEANGSATSSTTGETTGGTSAPNGSSDSAGSTTGTSSGSSTGSSQIQVAGGGSYSLAVTVEKPSASYGRLIKVETVGK